MSSEDGSAIEWDDEEKFYDAELWLAYLIDTFLAPDAGLARELAGPVPGRVYPEDFAHFTFDHVANGVLRAEGEEPDDRWRIEVRDNVVYVVRYVVEPEYDEISPADPDEWGDAEWAEFHGRIRSHVAFVVRDGRLEEVDRAAGIAFDPVDPPDGD